MSKKYSMPYKNALYGFYSNALKYLYKEKEKHFLIASRRAVKDAVIGNRIQHGAVFSVVRNKRGMHPKGWEMSGEYNRAGTLEGEFSKLPRKLTTELNDIRDKYMELIFAESNKLVPIDKKYIGKYAVGGVIGRKSDTYIASSTWRNRQDSSGEMYYLSRNTKILPMEIQSGVYDVDTYNFLKEFYRNKNQYRKRLYSFVDSDTGIVYTGSSRYSTRGSTKFSKYKRGISYDFAGIDASGNPIKLEDIVPMNQRKDFRGFTRKEKTGGNKELKSSGYYDREKGIITYNPLNKGARWNYAQVQHDNLAYQHEQGEALYLWKAFEKYKKEFYDAVEKKTVDVFKRSIKDAYL